MYMRGFSNSDVCPSCFLSPTQEEWRDTHTHGERELMAETSWVADLLAGWCAERQLIPITDYRINHTNPRSYTFIHIQQRCYNVHVNVHMSDLKTWADSLHKEAVQPIAATAQASSSLPLQAHASLHPLNITPYVYLSV